MRIRILVNLRTNLIHSLQVKNLHFFYFFIPKKNLAYFYLLALRTRIASGLSSSTDMSQMILNYFDLFSLNTALNYYFWYFSILQCPCQAITDKNFSDLNVHSISAQGKYITYLMILFLLEYKFKLYLCLFISSAHPPANFFRKPVKIESCNLKMLRGKLGTKPPHVKDISLILYCYCSDAHNHVSSPAVRVVFQMR